MANKELKEKIKEKIAEVKRRKHMLGQLNITGVTKPKKVKPKREKEEQHAKPHQPGSVSIGPHGGRYVQEASGHRRYVAEGKLSGVRRFKKSIKEVLEDLITSEKIDNFVQEFKRRK